MTTTTTTTTTTMTPTSITAALARSTLRSFDCIVCECTDESLEGLCAHMLNQHSLVIRNIGLIHENAREYVVRDTHTHTLLDLSLYNTRISTWIHSGTCVAGVRISPLSPSHSTGAHFARNKRFDLAIKSASYT